MLPFGDIKSIHVLRRRSNNLKRTTLNVGIIKFYCWSTRVAFTFLLASQSLFSFAQFSPGTDPTVPGPVGGGGEAASSEVLLHRPGSVPQRASSVWTQEGLGAAGS